MDAQRVHDGRAEASLIHCDERRILGDAGALRHGLELAIVDAAEALALAKSWKLLHGTRTVVRVTEVSAKGSLEVQKRSERDVLLPLEIEIPRRGLVDQK
jgi:hypothetical protein